MEKLFQILAVIFAGIAAFFWWSGSPDGLFICAVLGAVSFFISIRFQVGARVKERRAGEEEEETRRRGDDEMAGRGDTETRGRGVEEEKNAEFPELPANEEFNELRTTNNEPLTTNHEQLPNGKGPTTKDEGRKNHMKILIAAFGSLGDMHPMNALGIELRRRGHEVIFAAMKFYREKIETLGFEFRPMRPHLDPNDRELARQLMDAKTGSELLLKKLILPNLRPMYDDLMAAVSDADAFISSEVVFAAPSVAEKTGLKWITTTLAPGTLLSAYDPFVPPTTQWLKHFRFLGSGFHSLLYRGVRRMLESWFGEYREFRRELGLSEEGNPLFEGKSKLLNLAMFSRVLGQPQPDWPVSTLQCGFCFYDGRDDLGKMPAELNKFLENGEPPIVFTLGSAAVMDARDFFEESAKAARILGCRGVLLYGIFNEPPGIIENGEPVPEIAAFDYAPYSQIFPKAACVVHQGGVGTTSQVLRAGVPHLIMPYSHDQPDNAARCERLGVAETIARDDYTAESAAQKLSALLSGQSFRTNAEAAAQIVRAEHGTQTACDAIEKVLQKSV